MHIHEKTMSYVYAILAFTLIDIHFAQCADFFGVDAMHKYDTYI